MQLTIPATAQWIPYLTAADVSTAVESHKRIIADYNARIGEIWRAGCAIWTPAAIWAEANHQLPPAKPVWQPQYIVRTADALAWVPVVNGVSTIEIHVPAEGELSGGVYMWDEEMPASVCPNPDPPKIVAKPIPEPEHVIGVPADDPVPAGVKVTRADGSVWQKNRATTPFGTVAWWERVS